MARWRLQAGGRPVFLLSTLRPLYAEARQVRVRRQGLPRPHANSVEIEYAAAGVD